MWDAPLLGPGAAPAIGVMTWNVRRRLPHLRASHPDRWEARRDVVASVLERERPAVLGVQEALDDQVAFLASALPGYGIVGRGRDRHGDDEHCAVLFDAERFEFVGWEQRALSATPEVPGSKPWWNPFPRVVVTVDLLDRVTRLPLRVVNTHLDPFSASARLRAATVIRSLSDDRTLVLGDANTGTDSPAFAALTAGGVLRDAWTAADDRRSPEWRTYSGYRPPRPGPRIDWLLVGRAFQVQAAAIGARVGGRAGSDHEAVQALVTATADAG